MRPVSSLHQQLVPIISLANLFPIASSSCIFFSELGARSSRGARSSPVIAILQLFFITQANNNRGDFHFCHSLLLQQYPSLPCRGCIGRSNIEGPPLRQSSFSQQTCLHREKRGGSSFVSNARPSPSTSPPAAASPGKSSLFSFSFFFYVKDLALCEGKLITFALCSACMSNSRMQVATVPSRDTGLGQ
jgi:hypothetical protein